MLSEKSRGNQFLHRVPWGTVLAWCSGLWIAPIWCLAYASLPRSLVTVLATSLLAIGLAVYGSVFAFIGAAFKRPLLIGLVFIFGWEQAAMAFPGYLRRFTVAYYLQALVPHAMPSDGIMGLIQAIFRETPSLMTSLTALFVILVVFLAWAARTVERREYVLEQ